MRATQVLVLAPAAVAAVASANVVAAAPPPDPLRWPSSTPAASDMPPSPRSWPPCTSRTPPGKAAAAQLTQAANQLQQQHEARVGAVDRRRPDAQLGSTELRTVSGVADPQTTGVADSAQRRTTPCTNATTSPSQPPAPPPAPPPLGLPSRAASPLRALVSVLTSPPPTPPLTHPVVAAAAELDQATAGENAEAHAPPLAAQTPPEAASAASVAALQARVSVLERELAASRDAAHDTGRRLAQLDATFDFWARVVLADARAAAAAGASERAQLVRRIERLEAGELAPADHAVGTPQHPHLTVPGPRLYAASDPLSIEAFCAAIESQQGSFVIGGTLPRAQVSQQSRVFRDGRWVDITEHSAGAPSCL
jgi:hypothetical protein